MMRIAVTGSRGQVAASLIERKGPELEIVSLGRPKFDLEDREAVIAGIIGARPDVVINAAAYTAVDKAEREEAVAARVRPLASASRMPCRATSAERSCSPAVSSR